jgi:hypothetical protein
MATMLDTIDRSAAAGILLSMAETSRQLERDIASAPTEAVREALSGRLQRLMEQRTALIGRYSSQDWEAKLIA